MLTIPKTLGACADMLYKLRAKRLEIEAKVATIKADEETLKEHLIKNLKADDANGIVGKIAKVNVISQKIGRAEDWDAFYSYVASTGQFELLQRRLSDTALRERWDAGEPVPGVVPYTILKTSVTKR